MVEVVWVNGSILSRLYMHNTSIVHVDPKRQLLLGCQGSQIDPLQLGHQFPEIHGKGCKRNGLVSGKFEFQQLAGSCVYLSFFSKGTELEDEMHFGSMELAVNLTRFLYGPISLGIESSKSNTPYGSACLDSL